jgi:superfamily II DNA helicase RecQ
MPRPDIGGVVDAGMSEAKEALNRVFGFADFRPGQQEVLEAVFAGENILAIMPTGSGKSLCYQLPALVRKGLTVVVSPLIALMRDQVQQLQARGIAAATLNSSISGADNAAVEAGLRRGLYRLVYVLPERLVRPDMPALLREAGAQMFAIDEAHCVSQWGHDFRPEYLGIAQAARAIGDLQIIAVTATAPEDRKRIERQKLDSLVALCESPRCRRQMPCGNCDICDQRWPSLVRIAAAQRVPSAIQRAARRLFAHRTAGFFADSGATDLAQVEEMGDKPWTFELPTARMQIEQLTARQNKLFVALKAKRLEIALRQRQAPVLIFDDAILFEMAKTCPKTNEEIMSIPGVQPEKFDRYGAMFVAVILDHSEFS